MIARLDLKIGDRCRFVRRDGQAEDVEIRGCGPNGEAIFQTADGYTWLSDESGVVGTSGRLEALTAPAPSPSPSPKLHAEISLDEWRHKIGRMKRW